MSSHPPMRRHAWVFFALVAALPLIGLILMVAGTAEAEPHRSPGIWYVDPGSDWIQADIEWDGDQRLIAVAAAEDTLVAIGSGHDLGTIWASTNASDWECVLEEPGFSPSDVAVGPNGWVIVGGSWQGRIDTSIDGVNWSTVFDEEGAALRTVAHLGDTMVVGGGSWPDGGDLVATVWTATDTGEWQVVTLPGGEATQIVELSQSEAGMIAAADAGRLWFSSDGESWEAVATRGLEAMGLTDIASTDGHLAVGWDWSGAAVAWVSANGIDWQAVSPPNDWEPHGVSVVDGEFLALGQFGDCQASVLGASGSGIFTDKASDAGTWTSSECREQMSIDEDNCEPTSARTTDAAVLPNGRVVVVGHW